MNEWRAETSLQIIIKNHIAINLVRARVSAECVYQFGETNDHSIFARFANVIMALTTKCQAVGCSGGASFNWLCEPTAKHHH